MTWENSRTPLGLCLIIAYYLAVLGFFLPALLDSWRAFMGGQSLIIPRYSRFLTYQSKSQGPKKLVKFG